MIKIFKITKTKVALSLSILSAVIFCMPQAANAEDVRNDIVIEGNASGLVTIPDTEDFLYKYCFLPGDKAYGTIKLSNKYDYPYEVFLRAQDSEKKSDLSLVKQLKLHIDEDGDDLYYGSLQGEEKMVNKISLGVINPGEEKVLNASVVLDGVTTTNEYKNRYASVKWIFTAERIVEDAKAESMKTADYSKVIIIATCAIAIISFGVIGLSKKRRDNCEKEN